MLENRLPPLFKKMLWFWVIFSISPFIAWWATNLSATAWWLGCWIVVWIWFVNSKADLLTRGLWFIMLSVFIAVIGKGLISPKDHKDIIDMIQNIMLLVSGGVGGNFMAHYLLHMPKQTSTKAPPSKQE